MVLCFVFSLENSFLWCLGVSGIWFYYFLAINNGRVDNIYVPSCSEINFVKKKLNEIYTNGSLHTVSLRFGETYVGFFDTNKSQKSSNNYLFKNLILCLKDFMLASEVVMDVSILTTQIIEVCWWQWRLWKKFTSRVDRKCLVQVHQKKYFYDFWFKTVQKFFYCRFLGPSGHSCDWKGSCSCQWSSWLHWKFWVKPFFSLSYKVWKN